MTYTSIAQLALEKAKVLLGVEKYLILLVNTSFSATPQK
jgi:hypothetical protein